MTHTEFIKANFIVLAETENSIFFDADGEKVAEIGCLSFDCNSVEEFYELIAEYGEPSAEELAI